MDPRPRRLSVIAGSASIAPVFPIHEARAREEDLAVGRKPDDLIGGHELEEIPSSRGRRGHALDHLNTTHFSASSFDDNLRWSDDVERDLEHGSPMPSKKSKSRSPNPRGRDSLRHQSNGSVSASSISSINGLTSSDAMNGAVERRKNVAHLLEVPGDSASDAADRLVARNTFSLDHPPPEDPKEASQSIGFFELPEKDRRNFLLLVLLYFLQGIPMGLASGSVPFLLKSHLSYGQIGIYTLASYPYSLKLLWSPIVDAVWSTRVGRRKSWILPIQTLSGLGMIWLGSRAQKMMEQAGEDGGAGVWNFTGWWFGLVLMCATQDIAVDGWALTLLSQSNLSYASTAQTVGLTAGQFLSFTVFLALSSPDFANKYFRSTPLDVGLTTLDSYLTFWGWAYLVVTVGLAVLKREDRTKERDGVWEVYKVMGGILKLKNVQTFIIIHLIAKIGFQANEAVTNLKLLDKGFSREDMALTVLIDFPFEIGLGYYAGKWSEQYKPVTVWCWAFVGRLGAAILAQLVVMSFPTAGTTTAYLLTVIVTHVVSTSFSTVMFVAISAFHAKIADPVIGGTYMTLLATVSNLGGTFPRFFILKFVDLFTAATCVPATNPPADLKGTLITQPFSCALEAEKHRCIEGAGTCRIDRDGYYIVNILCVIFGVVTFWSFIKPAALKLQTLPLRAWRVTG